jgi:hypothetical protein
MDVFFSIYGISERKEVSEDVAISYVVFCAVPGIYDKEIILYCKQQVVK